MTITVPKRDDNGNIIPGLMETRAVRVLDLINNREAIETAIEGKIKIEGEKSRNRNQGNPAWRTCHPTGTSCFEAPRTVGWPA